MGTEKFCLRWNDFESNISSAFRDLRDDKDFFDLTLACEDDEKIQAHKVILAACSSFFCHVLRHNPHPHPLLYLKGIKHTDLQSLLSFMYHGEVSVAQEELNSFLAVAEELKVKGLTENSPRCEKPPPPKPMPPQQTFYHGPQSKPITQPEDEIQEIPTIKSEPNEQPPAPQVQPHATNAGLEQTYEARREQAWDMDHEEVDQQIESLIQKNPEGGYLCKACGLIQHNKALMKRHVETHLDTPGYYCNFCGKQCKTRYSLRKHILRKHREETKKRPPAPQVKPHPLATDAGQKSAFTMEAREVTAQAEEAGLDNHENYEHKQYGTALEQTYEEGSDHSIGSSQAWEEVDQKIESLIQKNPEGGYLCAACGRINRSKGDLRKHVETHVDTPGYHCNFCGKQFKTRHCLSSHLSIKHREERKHAYN